MRVAMQQVKPSIQQRIGQRFIASVDDGSVVLHPLVQFSLHIIRPLADLEIHL